MGTVPWIFFGGEGSLKPTRFNASYGSSVDEGGHLSEVCLLHRLAFLLDHEFVGGREEAGPWCNENKEKGGGNSALWKNQEKASNGYVGLWAWIGIIGSDEMDYILGCPPSQ